MSPVAEINAMTLVERRALQLREAVATGSEARVERAAKALERAKESAARAAARARDREAARLQVEADRRDRERAAKQAAADQVEREVRRREPYCEVHAGGKVVRIRLAHEDALGRGTAVEAARRVVYQAVHRFQDAVVASRSRMEPAPERDWLAELAENTAGLLPARRLGLVSVADEESAAKRG